MFKLGTIDFIAHVKAQHCFEPDISQAVRITEANFINEETSKKKEENSYNQILNIHDKRDLIYCAFFPWYSCEILYKS